MRGIAGAIPLYYKKHFADRNTEINEIFRGYGGV